jgi:hypothetical protein
MRTKPVVTISPVCPTILAFSGERERSRATDAPVLQQRRFAGTSCEDRHSSGNVRELPACYPPKVPRLRCPACSAELKGKDTHCAQCGLARVPTSGSFELPRLAFWVLVAVVALFAIYMAMLAATRC